MEKLPGGLYPLILEATTPSHAQPGQQFLSRIMQRDDRGEVIGGASPAYVLQPAQPCAEATLGPARPAEIPVTR
jgi:hypothetical protein